MHFLVSWPSNVWNTAPIRSRALVPLFNPSFLPRGLSSGQGCSHLQGLHFQEHWAVIPPYKLLLYPQDYLFLNTTMSSEQRNLFSSAALSWLRLVWDLQAFEGKQASEQQGSISQ